MKKCPFCAELVQDAAIKCKHCGSRLDRKPIAWKKALPWAGAVLGVGALAGVGGLVFVYQEQQREEAKAAAERKEQDRLFEEQKAAITASRRDTLQDIYDAVGFISCDRGNEPVCEHPPPNACAYAKAICVRKIGPHTIRVLALGPEKTDRVLRVEME